MKKEEQQQQGAKKKKKNFDFLWVFLFGTSNIINNSCL